MTMTKPKVSRHRVPVREMRSDPITPEYQAEVDASMERLARRYAKAEKALAAAEQKAARARRHAEDLARKQDEAEAVAANRLDNERRLSEYIERIKEAAKNARVAQAREELQRKQREAIAKRDGETARRKLEAKAARERRDLIARQRTAISALETEVAERRRELHEIKLLMMPANYAGRDHRSGGARHVAG